MGCQLLNGTERGVCDPRAAGCSAAAASAATVAASGGVIYVRDTLGIYCRGPAAETCACLREYADCMRRRGCNADGGTALIENTGDLLSSPRDVEADGSFAASAWWETLGGWEGWGGLVGLCTAADCTAAQCGLPGPVCNQTGSACEAAFLSCSLADAASNRSSNTCGCLRRLVACLQDGACLQSGGSRGRIDALYAMWVSSSIFEEGFWEG